MEIIAIKCHKCGKYRLTSALCACEWKAAIDGANAENAKLRLQDIETIRLLRAEVLAARAGINEKGFWKYRGDWDEAQRESYTQARSATDAAGAMGEQR